MRTGTVKFSMNQRLRIITDEEQEKHFCSCFGINTEELREGDRVNMKKKEEKEKLLRKYSSYLTKNLFLP
jgi:NAD kinase